MRIISGEFKGRKLASFTGRRIRPTSDRVREAIFDLLPVEWEGKEIVDLFAGTGGLGIEALSRGACRVVFVEHHPQALKVLDKNLIMVNRVESSEVVRLEVEEGMKVIKRKGWKFDIAFLDPPYGKGLAGSTIRLVVEHEIMKDRGIVVVEHHRREVLLEHSPTLKLLDQRNYGKTGLALFVVHS